MRGMLLISLVFLGTSALTHAQLPAAAQKNSTVVAPAAPKPIASNEPLWNDLSAVEQTALRPLSAAWDGMNLGQKRKWRSVAKDFHKLPAPQQTKMHARMTEWTALSPQQRADARQNFAQNREMTDGLTPEQRKVQWQAYQQLSAEEKRKLGANSPKAATAGAAPAARPQPVLKKEPLPEFGTGKVLAKANAAPNAPAPGKKIAVAPHVANQGSILPSNATDSTNKP